MRYCQFYSVLIKEGEGGFVLPTPYSLFPKTQDFVPQPIENCDIYMLAISCRINPVYVVLLTT
ncbi:hypothetical protein [Moorena producens]|uniref:hypothetical protein n=1 Tax=Moorena producens TaxID=1155739 RepID=UPI003C72F3A3